MFEGLDEDLFAAEAHDALAEIYRTSDDEQAQDTADAILAADRKAQRQNGAAWALRMSLQDIPRLVAALRVAVAGCKWIDKPHYRDEIFERIEAALKGGAK